MPTIVNVEGLDFEELIPLLLANEIIKVEIEYYVEDGHVKEIEDHIIGTVEGLFDQLTNGCSPEYTPLSEALVQCLDMLNRVLYIEGDDYNIYLIPTKNIFKFIHKMIEDNFLDSMIEGGVEL